MATIEEEIYSDDEIIENNVVNDYERLSYRYFFNKDKIKDHYDLIHINKNAPKGFKYCNAFCQDFKTYEDFAGKKRECKECWSKIHKAKNQIKCSKITIEQFRENPDIINGIEITFNDEKCCSNCKQTKTIDQFSSNKNVCKTCKLLQNKERASKDIDNVISEVERLKINIDALYKYLNDVISRDKLYHVLSHYEIKRNSKDRKADMINNIIQYHKRVMDPKLCRGGCGFTMETEFTTCGECKAKKDKPKKYEKEVAFRENLDNIAKNLKRIELMDEDKFNKEQYYEISKKLDIKLVKSSCTKKDIISKINEFLDKRDEEEKKKEEEETNRILEEQIISEIEEQKYTLELNGIVILARKEDGYINVTKLCESQGKRIDKWKENKKSKELLETFKKLPRYDGKEPLISIKGGNSSIQGTYAHPDVAIQIAQWIDDFFALQVSSWIRELGTSGKVILGKEKTEEQLIELQRQLLEQKEIFKQLEKKHNKLLYKRQYHKLKEGPGFYIVSTNDGRFKIGMDEVSVNNRLQNYRTICPDVKLHCVIYTQKCKLLEDMMLSRYECKKLALNHEVIEKIDIEHLISSVKHIVEFCRFEATFECQEEINKYNENILL